MFSERERAVQKVLDVSAKLGMRPETIARRERDYASRLVSFAAHFSEPMDVLVSPPSTRPELIVPYRQALSKKFPDAIDRTEAFTSDGSVSSTHGASYEELLASISYKPFGDESKLNSIVIVNDVLARGRTVAAIIHRLKEAELSPTCSITIACPLWVRRHNVSLSRFAWPHRPA